MYANAWASEQLGAVADSLAHPVAVFRRSLVDEGVPEESADRLAAEFLAILLRDITKP